MKREETRLTVSSSFGEAEETLEVRQFPDGVPVAHVDIGFGQTVNTLNYSSMRYDVRVCVPCYSEEIDEAFNYARAIVEERAASLRAAIKEASGQ